MMAPELWTRLEDQTIQRPQARGRKDSVEDVFDVQLFTASHLCLYQYVKKLKPVFGTQVLFRQVADLFQKVPTKAEHVLGTSASFGQAIYSSEHL